MFGMLTKKDFQQIGELIDSKLDKRFNQFEEKITNKFDQKLEKGFGNFAIIINNSFNDIYKKFDEVGKRFDRIELELSKKADKEDIIRLESKISVNYNRLDSAEDKIRVINTKLKI
jgi:uncharacterized protein YaaN involved in tellurite resistance